MVGCAALTLALAAGCHYAYVPPLKDDLDARLNASFADEERAGAISDYAMLSILGRDRLDNAEALRLTQDPSAVVRARALALYLEHRELPAELERALYDDDAGVRAAAVNLMSRRKLVGGTDALAAFLARRAESDWTRCRAADALAATGERAAWAPLVEALSDESANVRFSAARALGTLWARRHHVGSPEQQMKADASAALTVLLEDPSDDVRLQVVRVLVAMGVNEASDETAEAVARAVMEAGGWRRLEMLNRIATRAGSRSRDLLKEVYDDQDESPAARYEAARGLNILGEVGRYKLEAKHRLAVREAFLRQGEYTEGNLASVGWRPSIMVGTDFEGTFTPDGGNQYYLHIRLDRQHADLVITGAYSELEENGTGRDAEVWLVGIGRGFSRSYSSAPGRQKHELRWVFSHGFSAGVIDFPSELNEYVFGWFLRAGYGVPAFGNWGLELFLDGHAWAEGRNSDWSLAGSVAAGVSLVKRF
jgi:HEAT repeat protein